jgi:hypothetical protein
VDAVVDLAPGAERTPLARYLADIVRQNVNRPLQKREFERLRGSVALVADDVGAALTLRFDFGRLTVHEGLVGVPDVTIRGATRDIETLADLRFSERLGVPLVLRADDVGRAAARDVLASLRSRRLKIYGLLLHVRLVLRFLRVLSKNG